MRMPASRRATRSNAAVMQVVEQMSRGARRAAPVVRDGAVREVSIHLARVHLTTLADELDQRLRPAPAPPRPARPVRARMHQRVQGSRHEAVVDEDVLLDVEGRVETFEVAGAVTLDAVSQGQIKRASSRVVKGGPSAGRRSLVRRLSCDGVYVRKLSCDGVKSTAI